MIPIKDTLKFYSVSTKPGNFGATLYNTAFQHLKINAIYLPLSCEKNQFANFYKSMSMIANGLSVSMPFKKDAFHLCEVLGGPAKDVGSVNTVLFNTKQNVGFGFNTDYNGFLAACQNELQKNKIQNVAIYGTGGVATTIRKALASIKINSTLVPRNDDYYLSNKKQEYDGLINATPVGMAEVEDNVFDEKIVKRYRFLFDAVVRRETSLIQYAKINKVANVNGVAMSLEQLCEQFKIYTGEVIEPPKDLFIKTLKETGFL